MIHVIGDFIQSVGVLIAAIILTFWPEYTLIDPLCTFLFSILVIFTTVPIVKDCLNVLNNSTPRGFDKEEFMHELKSVTHVREVRSLKIWSLNLEKTLCSGIIEIDSD
jgi:zinc transporter 2